MMAITLGDIFPALARLQIRIQVPLGYYVYCFDNGMVTPEELFEHPLVKEGKVLVGTELLFWADLLTVHVDLIEEGVDANSLEQSYENRITYRATPAEGPYAYKGLELSRHSAGTFDYEAEVAAVRRR